MYIYICPKIISRVGRGSIYRANSHKNSKKWWSKDLILLTMTCEDEWESIEYEGRWGGKYRPIYNIEGNRKELRLKELKGEDGIDTVSTEGSE